MSQHQHTHHHYLSDSDDKNITDTFPLPSSEMIEQVITVTGMTIDPPSDPASNYNYAEALQKTLYFYEAQKAGPGVTGGRVMWRGDSNLEDMAVPLRPMDSLGIGTNLSQGFIDAHRQWLDPAGKGTIDVSGGFYDAGDHVKFGLPQAYTASTLGWSFYEFRQAFIDTGLETQMLEILRWFTDYFLHSTFRDDQGKVIAFAYQVGDGNLDHKVWAPPEVQKIPRPVHFATEEAPASDVCGDTAAALALMYLNVKEIDPAYATTCLDVAQALYAFASTNRGLGHSGGFYNSTYDEDELSWGAVWLFVATQQASYLNDIMATNAEGEYIGYLKRVMATTGDMWHNVAVHNWDAVWGGVFLKLAHITDAAKFWDIARWNLEYWSGIPHQDANDTNYLPPTPAGFKVLSIWGSARFNTAAQLCTLLYRKYTGSVDFAEWARGQMDYIMGQNPQERSYIIGFGKNYACHPHHRAGHGSFNGSLVDPTHHRHILWGGLVGGPNPEDQHADLTEDFIYNEVALDYNAGLVGALAGLYTYYGNGQQPLADFPPQEPTVEPYFVEAMEDKGHITLILHNDSIHPPHFERNMKVRYFFKGTGVLIAGQALKDSALQIFVDEQQAAYDGTIAVHGPVAWDASAGLYYYEFDWSGYDVWGRRTLEFAFTRATTPPSEQKWEQKDDWSHQGLTSLPKVTPYIPVYLSGKLAYGEEPPL
jgi:endoglucanase